MHIDTLICTFNIEKIRELLVRGDEGFMKLALTLEGALGGRDDIASLALLTEIKAQLRKNQLPTIINFSLRFCDCLHHD